MGALAFAFVEPEQAAHWVEEYYDIIKSEECVPIGHTVNPNVAVVSALSVNQDQEEAVRRDVDVVVSRELALQRFLGGRTAR